MPSIKNLVPLLFLAACAPQSAELQNGSYVAFMAEGTSLSLSKGEVDPSLYETSYNLDCRDFENAQDRNLFQLEDPIPCGATFPTEHELWANDAGFRVVTEELEPWRGEAFIGAEGDMQIGFHHRVPGGADMRFLMVVDPNFQPTTCVPSGDGTVSVEPLDGDWIENWSTELDTIASANGGVDPAFAHLEPYLDGGRLFFLNGTSYQVNPLNADPSSGNDFWLLPDQFEAGATRGKIAEELLLMRQSIWGRPMVYQVVEDEEDEDAAPFEQTDLWWCRLNEGDNPNNAECAFPALYDDMDDLENEVTTVADETYQEYRRMFRPVNGEDPVFEYRPITHLNRWREPDGVPAGFDGWGEMHYNYVVFSGDSDLEVGGFAEGAFSLQLEAVDSDTRVILKGQFVIESIKKDRWTTADLRAEKAEENDVELCFQQ